MSRIHYAKPSITELEIRYATDAATHGWGERCYEYIDRFEAAFRAHLDVPFAIATSSCTGALHMGMAALGIGPRLIAQVMQGNLEHRSVERRGYPVACNVGDQHADKAVFFEKIIKVAADASRGQADGLDLVIFVSGICLR